MRHFIVLVLMVVCSIALCGQERRAPATAEHTTEGEHPRDAEPKPPVADKEKEPPEEKPVVTHHQIAIAGKTLRYTATVGMMPIKNEQTNKVEAHMFYVAYTLDNPPVGRPLTFAFNGGPGSSSVWLHMGAIGPKRVKMLPEGGMPAPPFQVEDNQYTWLDATDLVFIDPVGTGYSRALTPELGKKFWSLQGDIASVGEFIRMYLTRSQRWTSPLFLAGESYGTTRAAGLSGYLIDRGIPLNGITLISSVLHFETLSFARGNDLPYIAYLPTYAMTAQYHKKLPPDEQAMDGAKLLAEVMQWANTGYTEALQKGDRLTADERRATTERLARYTGLSPVIIDEHDLRIDQQTFSRELLRDRKLQVGRLDTRFLGPASPGGVGGDLYGYDPSEAAIRPPFTTVLNEYIRSDLGYKTDLIYYILGGGIGAQWDMGTGARGGFPETADALRRAFVKNPYMRVLVAEGWYDNATPINGIEYTLAHMGLDAAMRNNISTAQYPAGHMVYIQVTSLAKMKKDVVEMMQQALKGGGNDLSPAK
ncbi:MAG: peptidase S10 [Acidobacteriia bacterium]|nr:peptidase S10 [Terriglobia bacterium]